MPSPYRNPAEGSKRPALWIPGELLVRPWLDGRARVLVGDDVGFTDVGEETLRVPGFRFVEKAVLDESVRREASVALPEDAVDAARFPRVARAARASRLVLVTKKQATRLASLGAAVYVADDLDERDKEGGALLVGRVEQPMTVLLLSLVQSAERRLEGSRGGEEAVALRGSAGFGDRHRFARDHVLEGTSGGLLAPHRLDLACALAIAVHPSATTALQLSGDPSRANPPPSTSSPEEKLARWEEWLEAIEARAARTDTWLAPEDARLPATEVKTQDLLRRGIRVVQFPEIEDAGASLPEAHYLVADGVIPWRPAFRRTPPAPRDPGRGAGLFFLALLAAALVLWALGRAREAAQPAGLAPDRGAPAHVLRAEDQDDG